MTSSGGSEGWHRTAAIATAICMVVAVALFIWEPRVALGFVGGVVTGAGMLSALVVVLNRVVVPPQEREGHPAPWIVLHVAKFVLAGVLAYVVIEILDGDLIAFAGGYTVALIVLLLIMGGQPTVTNHLAATDERETAQEDTDGLSD